MDALVTVAIPTYERLELLKEAVSSALGQTYRNVEVLIGDDGSSPLLRKWGEQQESAQPAIRYQRNRRNLGLAGNWNALVDAARGEFIVIIGDDDRILPDFIRRCVEAIRPGRALAFSNHYVIDEQGKRLDEETRDFSIRYGRADLAPGVVADAEACAWRNAIPISASLFRTADARRLRFKEDLNNPEIELFIRLARTGGKFAFVPEYLAEYRTHGASVTASAGLRSDRLVDCLLCLEVRPEIEMIKKELLAELMVNAVSRCLLAEDPRKALEFLKSRYYPEKERKRIRGLLQQASARLPVGFGSRFYRAIWILKQLRRHAK